MSSTAALAEPFEYVARYSPLPGEKNEAGEIPLGEDAVIPRDAITHTLTEFRFRIKSDNASKASLSNVERVWVNVGCVSERCKTTLSSVTDLHLTIDPAKENDRLVIKASAIGGGIASDEPETIFLTARSYLKTSYLCAKEVELREGKEKSHLDQKRFQQATADALAGEPPPVEAIHSSALLFRQLTPTGEPVLASFCDDLSRQLDWKKLAKAAGTKSADALQDEKMKQLAQLLSEFMNSGGTQVVKVDGDKLYVEVVRKITLLRDLAGHAELYEYARDGTRPIAGTIDQDATINLRFEDTNYCGAVGCATFVKSHLSVTLESKDNKDNNVRKEFVPVPMGGEWVIQAALSDYVNQDATFTLAYDAPSSDGAAGRAFRIGLLRRKATVRNLGVVMSFPVVSEVVSLVSRGLNQSVDPKDDAFKSSIPISYAFGLGSAGTAPRLAITAPWMVGYNPRKAPGLAHIVRGFAHASVILAVEGATEGAEVGFGAGIALVDAFAFSWALTLTGHHFVLLGISIPDLAQIVH